MSEAAACRGRRLAASCRWKEALAALDEADPWCCVDIRAACLVELKRSSELFAFAHTLVDAYPNAWTSWYAVGGYYYLIGMFLCSEIIFLLYNHYHWANPIVFSEPKTPKKI